MKKVCFVIVMALLVFFSFSGCKRENGYISELELTESKSEDEKQAENDEVLKGSEEIDTTVLEETSIIEENKDKQQYNENNIPVVPELAQYSGTSKYEEKEQVTREYVDEYKSTEGESINEKTYVYEEHLLYPRFVPNCDYGRWIGNTVIKSMYGNLNAFPTEAIREENGLICLIYDTVSGMRIFSWNIKFGGMYQQYGHVIYMAETLSHSDFEDIKIGDYSIVVEEIDPKVVEIHLRKHLKETEEIQHTKIAIQNGYPPRSLHLLTDGLLIITYGRDETGFYITDIEFHEDFTIDTVAGPQCCKIDPLDYVTQG